MSSLKSRDSRTENSIKIGGIPQHLKNTIGNYLQNIIRSFYFQCYYGFSFIKKLSNSSFIYFLFKTGNGIDLCIHSSISMCT